MPRASQQKSRQTFIILVMNACLTFNNDLKVFIIHILKEITGYEVMDP